MCSDRTDQEISNQQDCRETLSFYPWPVWYIVLYKYSIVLSINQTKTKRPISSFLHIWKPLLAFRKLDEIIISNYNNIALHYILTKYIFTPWYFQVASVWWRQNHPIIVNPLIPTLTLYPNPNLCGFEVKSICLLWLDACQGTVTYCNPHQLNHTFSCYTFVFVWIKPTGYKVYVVISVPFEENHACCFPPVSWLLAVAFV